MELHLLDTRVNTFIEIDPTWGFLQTGTIVENSQRTLGGILRSTVWDSYNRYTIPLQYVNSSVQSAINENWKADNDIFLVFNKTNSIESIQCKFTNKTKPLDRYNRPNDNVWNGVIHLNAISKADVIAGVPFFLDDANFGVLDSDTLG